MWGPPTRPTTLKCVTSRPAARPGDKSRPGSGGHHEGRQRFLLFRLKPSHLSPAPERTGPPFPRQQHPLAAERGPTPPTQDEGKDVDTADPDSARSLHLPACPPARRVRPVRGTGLLAPR